jgi:hypothetical protein
MIGLSRSLALIGIWASAICQLAAYVGVDLAQRVTVANCTVALAHFLVCFFAVAVANVELEKSKGAPRTIFWSYLRKFSTSQQLLLLPAVYGMSMSVYASRRVSALGVDRENASLFWDAIQWTSAALALHSIAYCLCTLMLLKISATPALSHAPNYPGKDSQAFER